MMAKLVCARHKPRQQTLIPWFYVREILRLTPIGDVRGFGGKMGNRIQEMLNITVRKRKYSKFQVIFRIFIEKLSKMSEICNFRRFYTIFKYFSLNLEIWKYSKKKSIFSGKKKEILRFSQLKMCEKFDF